MIGIVGGGISGLAVAHHLDRRGVPFLVFEAADRPGGVMETFHVDGYPLDTGPQRTRVTGDVRALIEAAGLEDAILEAPEDIPLWVYSRGKLREVPLDVGSALTSSLLSPLGKLRVLVEPFVPPAKDAETVERFLTRSFGREAYTRMLGPYYGGLYGSDPGRMYVRHGLRMTLDHFGVQGSLLKAFLTRGAEARQSIATVSFERGMQQLPDGLAARYGDAVRLGRRLCRMTAADDAAPGADSPGYVLHFEGGGSAEVDRVVLSLSAPDAARALEQIAPDAARRIGALRYNRLACVHMEADGSGIPLHGAGYQVAFDEGLETRGVTWNGALFGRGNLCAAYLGGMRRPEVVDWPDDRIAEVAQRELEEVTGHGSRLLKVSRTWIPAWDETWDALDGLELPPGVHLCANWNARPGIPGRAAAARRVAAEVAALEEEGAGSEEPAPVAADRDD